MRKFHSLLGRRRGKTTDYAPEETPTPPQEETPATPATLAGTTGKSLQAPTTAFSRAYHLHSMKTKRLRRTLPTSR